MCKLSMYLVVTYQSSYIYIGPISCRRGYQRWTQIFNSAEVHWVIMWGIQWILVGAGSLWPLALPMYRKKAPGPIEMTEGGSDELFIWQCRTWMRATFTQWWETWPVYLWRKVVCFVLFCFVGMRSTEPGMLQIVFLVSLESSRWERVHGLWFHDFWTSDAKVLEYWMFSSLKIKLNCSWKFSRNWNVPLVFLKRSCGGGFNGIYLVRFGFKIWETLIWESFLPVKLQINSKKPGFGRKNHLRTW